MAKKYNERGYLYYIGAVVSLILGVLIAVLGFLFGGGIFAVFIGLLFFVQAIYYFLKAKGHNVGGILSLVIGVLLIIFGFLFGWGLIAVLIGLFFLGKGIYSLVMHNEPTQVDYNENSKSQSPAKPPENAPNCKKCGVQLVFDSSDSRLHCPKCKKII
jgi:predicted membrane protein